MFILQNREIYEQDIKKSRFMAIAAPITTQEDAKTFLLHESDLSANHNCWAWRLGQNYRFNDDGEPSGTAGKPILQAIDSHQLDNIVVVVTRWFGGILLGSGGLMRAYGGTAAQCLRNAQKDEFIERTPLYIRCAFSELSLVKARLSAYEQLIIVNESFHQTGADLQLLLPTTITLEVRNLLTNLSSGRIQITDRSEDLSY